MSDLFFKLMGAIDVVVKSSPFKGVDTVLVEQEVTIAGYDGGVGVLLDALKLL